MYPMALIFVFLLSCQLFPHMLESSDNSSVSKPFLELVVAQSLSLFAKRTILAFDIEQILFPLSTLDPFLLQLTCQEVCDLINVFHEFQCSEEARYFPSAISAYSELTCFLMTRNLI